MTPTTQPGIDVTQLKPSGEFALVDGSEYSASIDPATNRVVVFLLAGQPEATRLGKPHAVPISGDLQYVVDARLPDRVFRRWDRVRYRNAWIRIGRVVDDGAAVDGALLMSSAWNLRPDDPYRYQGRDHEDQRIRLPIDKIDEVIVSELDYKPRRRPRPIDPATVVTVYRWPPEPTGHPAPSIP
jgi:hypothetical protein